MNPSLAAYSSCDITGACTGIYSASFNHQTQRNSHANDDREKHIEEEDDGSNLAPKGKRVTC